MSIPTHPTMSDSPSFYAPLQGPFQDTPSTPPTTQQNPPQFPPANIIQWSLDDIIKWSRTQGIPCSLNDVINVITQSQTNGIRWSLADVITWSKANGVGWPLADVITWSEAHGIRWTSSDVAIRLLLGPNTSLEDLRQDLEASAKQPQSKTNPTPTQINPTLAQIKENLKFIQRTIACTCNFYLDSIPPTLQKMEDLAAIQHLGDKDTFSKLSPIFNAAIVSDKPPKDWDTDEALKEPRQFLEALSQVEQSLIQQLTIFDPSTPQPLSTGAIALAHKQ